MSTLAADGPPLVRPIVASRGLQLIVGTLLLGAVLLLWLDASGGATGLVGC